MIDGDVLIAALERRRESYNTGRRQIALVSDNEPGMDRFMANIGFLFELETLIRYVRLLQYRGKKARL